MAAVDAASLTAAQVAMLTEELTRQAEEYKAEGKRGVRQALLTHLSIQFSMRAI